MSWEFEAKSIIVQRDKLQPIDTENFQIERFKRAKVRVDFYDSGRRVPLKLTLELRGKVLTVSTSDDEAPVGQYGAAIITEWSVAMDEDSLLQTVEDISRVRGAAHFTIRDPDNFLGYLHHLKQRGRIRPLWQG